MPMCQRESPACLFQIEVKLDFAAELPKRRPFGLLLHLLQACNERRRDAEAGNLAGRCARHSALTVISAFMTPVYEYGKRWSSVWSQLRQSSGSGSVMRTVVPLPDLAVDADLPAVLLHEVLTDRQTKARTFAARLGGEEWAKRTALSPLRSCPGRYLGFRPMTAPPSLRERNVSVPGFSVHRLQGVQRPG